MCRMAHIIITPSPASHLHPSGSPWWRRHGTHPQNNDSTPPRGIQDRRILKIKLCVLKWEYLNFSTVLIFYFKTIVCCCKKFPNNVRGSHLVGRYYYYMSWKQFKENYLITSTHRYNFHPNIFARSATHSNTSRTPSHSPERILLKFSST